MHFKEACKGFHCCSVCEMIKDYKKIACDP